MRFRAKVKGRRSRKLFRRSSGFKSANGRSSGLRRGGIRL